MAWTPIHRRRRCSSRYCSSRIVLPFDENRPQPYLDGLLDVGRRFGRRAILIATSDETTQFVADHAAALRDAFVFQDNSPTLVPSACEQARDVRAGDTAWRADAADELPAVASTTSWPTRTEGRFPVMLKGIYGNRLQQRTQKKMVIVQTRAELLQAYREMEDPDSPNLMLQEYIPGGDDQVYIFNGYFNRAVRLPGRLHGLQGSPIPRTRRVRVAR